MSEKRESPELQAWRTNGYTKRLREQYERELQSAEQMFFDICNQTTDPRVAASFTRVTHLKMLIGVMTPKVQVDDGL